MRVSLSILAIMYIISPYPNVHAQDANQYIEVTLGGSIPQLAQTQATVFPAVSDRQAHDIATTQQAGCALTFSISAGRQFALHVTDRPGWLSYYRLGLRYANQESEHLSDQGRWAGYAHMRDVYQFSYRVQTQFLLADLALSLYHWARIRTYLHLATGPAFVQVSHYNETAGSDLPGKQSYAFSHHFATQLGGIIGLGVDYPWRTNWHTLLTMDYFTPVIAALGHGSTLLYATPSGPRVSLANLSLNLGLRYAF